jgi:hypothetical protein
MKSFKISTYEGDDILIIGLGKSSEDPDWDDSQAPVSAHIMRCSNGQP